MMRGSEAGLWEKVYARLGMQPVWDRTMAEDLPRLLAAILTKIEACEERAVAAATPPPESQIKTP